MNFNVFFPEVKFTGSRMLSKKIKLIGDECINAYLLSKKALR